MRIIDQKLWQDAKWRKHLKNIEERYFWLYLLTCPNSKSCGIFYLPIEIASMESKISESSIETYIKHLSALKMVKYNEETEEILIYNLPRYNIIRLGKPMEDCIRKELSLVKDKSLIKDIITYLDSIGDNKLTNITNIYKSITTNTNTNNDSCHDSEEDDTDWEKMFKELGE